jgi:hypothetical protein
MNHQDTQDLIDAIKPFCSLETLSISTENLDWKGRPYQSDWVNILKKHNICFEVFENEIIIQFFDDHVRFENWTSDDKTDRSYFSYAKEFLINLFTQPIRKVEVYRGNRLMRFKYMFIMQDGKEESMAGTMCLHLFSNPFSRKTTKETIVKYRRKNNDFEPFELRNTPLVEVGGTVSFGSYPQTTDPNDSSLIFWRVLEWKDCVDTTWKDCDLREWLNTEFYQKAFTDSEKELIAVTTCRDNGDGSPDTQDKVFLLSVNEALAIREQFGKELWQAIGTEYAKLKKEDGSNLYVYDMTNEENYVYRNGIKKGCSWWWLRTQGNKPSRAYFIGTECSLRSYANVSIAREGIRPAIKIKTSYLI